jgi:hypothetical protein
MKKISSILLVLFLISCGNRKCFKQLSYGMTEEQVFSICGEPSQTKHGISGGGNETTWIYERVIGGVMLIFNNHKLYYMSSVADY